MKSITHGTVSWLLFYLVISLLSGIDMIILPATSAAQPEQDDQKIAETGIEFQPRLGEYHYEIMWGGNRVGTGVIRIERDADHYVVKAKKKTTGLVDIIFRLQYMGEARIKVAGLFPVDATLVEEDRKRKKIQEVQYPSSKESGPIKVVETRTRKKQQDVETKEYEFVSHSGHVDIFSAIFLARSFHWQIGERHEFIMFSGSKQYRVSMDCIGETMVEVGDEQIPVWIVQPTSSKIFEDTETFSHTDTLVYLSADESKDLVKVKTKLGIGSVKLRLVNYLEK